MANKELKARVGSPEATIAENKNKVEQADELLNHNIDLHTKLREKSDKIVEVEEACKKAEELAESNAQRLEYSRKALLACMRDAKVALDVVFAKAGSMVTDDLPEANAVAFSSWLSTEVGHLLPLLDSVLDFGAFGATLGVARSFQATVCDHLKKLG